MALKYQIFTKNTSLFAEIELSDKITEEMKKKIIGKNEKHKIKKLSDIALNMWYNPMIPIYDINRRLEMIYIIINKNLMGCKMFNPMCINQPMGLMMNPMTMTNRIYQPMGHMMNPMTITNSIYQPMGRMMNPMTMMNSMNMTNNRMVINSNNINNIPLNKCGSNESNPQKSSNYKNSDNFKGLDLNKKR